MIQLTMNHLNAVCHAEFYLHKASAQFLEPNMRAQLEDDLLRLNELKAHLILQLTNNSNLFTPGPADG